MLFLEPKLLNLKKLKELRRILMLGMLSLAQQKQMICAVCLIQTGIKTLKAMMHLSKRSQLTSKMLKRQ